MPVNVNLLAEPSPEDLRAWHRVQSAAFAHDRPGEPAPSETALRARPAIPGAHGRTLLWLVRGSAEEAVATAALRLSDEPGRSHLAQAEITVHPAHRRLGTGSRLLSTLTEAATGAGCRGLVTEVMAGTPGEGFLATRDFVPVLRLTWLRLVLDDVPDRIRKLPDVVHPGYRLASWEGVVPDALADAYARARSAKGGTPPGGTAAGEVRRYAERGRETARPAPRHGERLLTVAAVSKADGSVAGWTELILPGDGSPRAQQYDTAVLAAHRGHGLGLWIKAEMLRRVRDDHPGITEIQTDTADDNRHMLSVNTALGFRPLRRTVEYKLTLRGR
jgi:GNAT superfamily N-acetyltransferase